MFKKPAPTKYYFPTDPVAISRAESESAANSYADIHRRQARQPAGRRRERRSRFRLALEGFRRTKTAIGTTERHAIDAKFGRRAAFAHRRASRSLPAAADLLAACRARRGGVGLCCSGKIDCWLDGHIHPMGEGDFSAGSWHQSHHVVINNSGEDAVLLVGGEASRTKGQVWYPRIRIATNRLAKPSGSIIPRSSSAPMTVPDAMRAAAQSCARMR